MNCLEFRRRILVEPLTQDEAMQDHRRGCPACAHFAAAQGNIERQLRRAVHIEAPEGLSSRILLRQRMGPSPRGGWKHPLWLSLAAGLILALSITAGLMLEPTGESLQKTVLAHVNNELHHLNDRKDVKLDRLNDILRPHGAQFKHAPGTINYAGTCPIRKNRGVHVVVQTQTGPVTMLLMPGEFVNSRQVVADQRFRGVIVPTENGSVAIVAEDESELERVEQQMQDILQFAS